MLPTHTYHKKIAAQYIRHTSGDDRCDVHTRYTGTHSTGTFVCDTKNAIPHFLFYLSRHSNSVNALYIYQPKVFLHRMVVSWDNANDGREGNLRDEQPTTAAADPSAVDQDGRGPFLFYLARRAKWDDLISRLEITPPDVIREQNDPISEDGEEINSLLHIVAVMENVPLKVVETILDRTSRQQDTIDGESVSSIGARKNQLQQTALHLAVMSMPERTDIIECLYHACPESVHARDYLRLRPIDIITQKIIMMEEVIKYSRMNEEEECRKMLGGLWRSVSVLVGATGTRQEHGIRENNASIEPTFLVHCCLRSKEVPFALTERAMKHNKQQLAAPDANGDLPLHVVARIPPLVQRTAQAPSTEDEDEEDERDDDEGDFLERVIDLYPEAACHFNNEQQIPLVVAIQAGRKWNSGLSLLLQVNPGGIEEARIPLNVFPFFLELLCKQTSTVYQVLQSQPGLFLYSRGDSDSRVSNR
jgi:hypothetical protein